jgi:hypothetical protein
MTREIEIEISDQSNIISFNILKGKKHDVDKLINDLLSLFSNYIFMSISTRNLMSHESLRRKSQSSFLLFQLFFCSFLLQIMIEHINIKTHLKKTEAFDKVRFWKDITSTEIETFVEILLYMRLCSMSRIEDYWNLSPSRSIHVMIINCMICQRWEQIKRFLKIFNLIHDHKINTRDSH